jgi:hypothetical protein
LAIIIIGLGWVFRKATNRKGTWNSFDDNINLIINEPDKQQMFKSGVDSKGETECRRVLENIFHRPFNKIRPNFLKNPVLKSQYPFELDCYNSELKLAIEYNGVQHYKFVPHFHKTEQNFHAQQYRDYIKNQLCKEYDICLIVVPFTVEINDIENHIKQKLQEHGYY